MHPSIRLLAIGVLACAVLACNRQGPELPVQGAAEADADGAAGVETVVVDPNAGFLGTSINENGEIVSPQRQFKLGETVYLSVPSKGRRLGSALEVFWFHEDGVSRKNEPKRIEGAFTTFEFSPEEAGRYNVELALDGRTFGLVEFEVL